MADLSTLSLVELADLKKKIDVEIVRRKEAEKQNLRAEMLRMAAAAGLSLADVLGAEKKGRKVASSGVAQFRNPADAEQTWTGRGRKPQWVLDWLASGKSIDDLRI
ncbi:DNA-binding protein H-NS [Formivibrio citricus]|uniref:DNA-binding protein H-NS n=1 Tax=Formivibrio citricus TaxID=83765 RepID=A0A1I4VUJ5_9NEIS|nr:H-NS histone family protein [Formivibrio citricus]SFN04855.1 DNA-binding protein H-NS [Formivibrio citricus]